MLLPKRHASDESYRYGFQGQEKDDKLKGEGNSFNYKYRMHDPRIGRFFATDPLDYKYPWYSPYQFSGNKVIQFIELEGLEEAWALDPDKISSLSELSVALNEEAAKKEDIFDKVSRRAKTLIKLYEKGEHLLDEDEKLGYFYKQKIYFFAFFKEFGGYTDAEDVSVLTEGKTIEGDEATALDYTFAGIGTFIPFVSGGLFKKLFKSSADELTEKAVKLDDGKTLNLSTKGNSFDGNIKLSNDSGVIFDAKFNISMDGKTLTLDEIGIYQHKNGNILGSEAKNSLGKLPFEILGKIKAQAKSEGFETLTIKYKRELFDDAGKFIGYGEDQVRHIPLNN